MRISNGSSTLNNALNVQNLDITGGSLTLGGNLTVQNFTMSGGTLNLNGHRLILPGTANTLSGGTISGAGGVTNNGTLTLSDGTINSVFDNPGIINATYANISGTLNNTGTLNLIGYGNLYGSGSIISSTTIRDRTTTVIPILPSTFKIWAELRSAGFAHDRKR